MIKLHGLSTKQMMLADCLWNKCQTQNDVDTVIKMFGHDARVVYELIMAETMDRYMGTEDALNILNSIRDKYEGSY